MTLFADAVLARRLESHEAFGIATSIETLKRLRPEVGATTEPLGCGYLIYAGQDSPINRAIGLGLDGAVTVADIERAEQFYHSRNAPAQIDLCPLADASLRRLLGERGYQLKEFFNIWTLPLADYDSTRVAAGRVFVRETEPADAERWINAVSRGFAEHEELLPAELEVATVFFHEPETRCFLSFVDGRPAGGGVIFIHDRLAALFSGSTVVEARGRGAQTALLHARLLAAREAGCDLAVIKTAPGNASQRNVQRAGFQLAYTKVSMSRERQSWVE